MNNPNNTITTARNFLKEKINSLKKDCEQCLFSKHPAPFPALLYCFSVIDLLGALFSGNAEDSAPTTQLKIEPTDQKGEFWFRISLWDFVEDIEDSVFGSNGYMNLLLKNVGNSQDNFEKAYKKIHG